MSIVCDSLSSESLTALNQLLADSNKDQPLRKIVSPVIQVDGVAVFTLSDGFIFRRISTTLEEAVRDEITGLKREYLCSAFEVTGSDPTVIQKIFDRFVESHGVKLAGQIDHVVIERAGKTILLVNFPSSVLRHMMAPNGGLMRTEFSGAKDALRQIPILAKCAYIPEEGSDPYTGQLVTEYPGAMFAQVNAMHYDIVRQVVANPGLGITLRNIAQWDA